MCVGDAIWTAALGQAQALPYLPEELEAIILGFTLPARKRRLFARVHEELRAHTPMPHWQRFLLSGQPPYPHYL